MSSLSDLVTVALLSAAAAAAVSSVLVSGLPVRRVCSLTHLLTPSTPLDFYLVYGCMLLPDEKSRCILECFFDVLVSYA